MPDRSYRFEIADLTTWDDDVHRHALQFREVAAAYPNRIEGSEETWDRISRFVAQGETRANVRGEDGRPPVPGGSVGLGAFCTAEYCLEVWIDDDLPPDTLALAWEADTDGCAAG